MPPVKLSGWVWLIDEEEWTGLAGLIEAPF
jgi:hypothetical protein